MSAIYYSITTLVKTLAEDLNEIQSCSGANLTAFIIFKSKAVYVSRGHKQHINNDS